MIRWHVLLMVSTLTGIGKVVEPVLDMIARIPMDMLRITTIGRDGYTTVASTI